MADPRPSGLALAQTGVILFVERYDACVNFYRDAIGLPIVETLATLTIFAFGASYLEIEQGGVAGDGVKPRDCNPTVLRFDVDDLDAATEHLRAKGVAVARLAFDWGEIGVFVDPDGNRRELKRHDVTQTVLSKNDG